MKYEINFQISSNGKTTHLYFTCMGIDATMDLARALMNSLEYIHISIYKLPR